MNAKTKRSIEVAEEFIKRTNQMSRDLEIGSRSVLASVDTISAATQKLLNTIAQVENFEIRLLDQVAKDAHSAFCRLVDLMEQRKQMFESSLKVLPQGETKPQPDTSPWEDT